MQFRKMLVLFSFGELLSFPVFSQEHNLENYKLLNMLNYSRDFVGDEKPTVFMHFKFNEIHFNVLKKLNCASATDAAGCTQYKLGFNLVHDCSKNRIDITIMDTEDSPLIELDEHYKNTPFWDQILKHEMTHVQIYRGNAKKIAPQIASSTVAKYDKLLTQSNSCKYIKTEIYNTVFSKFQEMTAEIEKKQALIDGTDNYLYQSLQVLKKNK